MVERWEKKNIGLLSAGTRWLGMSILHMEIVLIQAQGFSPSVTVLLTGMIVLLFLLLVLVLYIVFSMFLFHSLYYYNM